MIGRYRDATALRRALEARLEQEADESGTDLARRPGGATAARSWRRS